ncbi:Coiled-coil domain-containing protein [Actinidia chinensis var. chinensis]|uniref:Coiled-coil domain-containing protein n=1 Tax=Actinidia chinensis var. chinensis TaxID=1590841 RepID=A0A2R6RYT8_ACTCC|nr:Coiled-coil domain-containing protein [Actinidia chinensis var. chinensis]
MASTPETTPDLSPNDSDSGDEMQELIFANRGCCHFIPFFSCQRSNGSGSIWWERISKQSSEKEENWWAKGLKKLRDWSELVAGPRWKTFIRQFNKNRSYCCGPRIGKFQYDPVSYALNFDDGLGQNSHYSDADRVFRDFSSRYAAIPISAKSSMDLRRDAPSFA